jgi:aminoglycoside phosphotransferase family enzyme/predicted kinase
MTAAPDIQAIETHISMLFFTPDRVFKLLKPLHLGFLDHRDARRRMEAVTSEFLLNRRIAPDVYLGTSDVIENGEPVDRLLVMRRLPAERCLSRLTDAPDFDDHLRRIARTVAAFHASLDVVTAPFPMTTASGLADLWTSSFDEIEPSVGTVIDRDEFDRARQLAITYLEHSGPLFEHRRDGGMIRDGHGDLIADDIFMLDDGPRILDCIAFDDDYRISDVLADIAFLVMDVERLAGPGPAQRLMNWYCELSGEHHPTSLAHHYVAYRAHVRAKVAVIRHRQGDSSAIGLARTHHRQAVDHLDRSRRRVVLVGGGPGTGKTTVANEIADRFNWSVVDSDTLRKDLRGIDHNDHDVDRHPDLYDRATTSETYSLLCAQADVLLAAGESVVLDATWIDDDHRMMARAMAQRHGAELVEFECRLDPAIARQRIIERAWNDASDATPELVDEMARRRHPWPTAHELNTALTAGEVIGRAVEALRTSGAR